jgi:hypothetical protein
MVSRRPRGAVQFRPFAATSREPQPARKTDTDGTDPPEGERRAPRLAGPSQAAVEPIIVKAHAQAMADQARGHRIEHLLEGEPLVEVTVTIVSS